MTTSPVHRALETARRVLHAFAPAVAERAESVIGPTEADAAAREGGPRRRVPTPIPPLPPPRLRVAARTAAEAARRTAGVAGDGARATMKTARAAAEATAQTAAEGMTAAGEAVTAAQTPEVGAEEPAYEDMTKAELYELAQEADIEGRSTMNKDELIAALRRHAGDTPSD